MACLPENTVRLAMLGAAISLGDKLDLFVRLGVVPAHSLGVISVDVCMCGLYGWGVWLRGQAKLEEGRDGMERLTRTHLLR